MKKFIQKISENIIAIKAVRKKEMATKILTAMIYVTWKRYKKYWGGSLKAINRNHLRKRIVFSHMVSQKVLEGRAQAIFKKFIQQAVPIYAFKSTLRKFFKGFGLIQIKIKD